MDYAIPAIPKKYRHLTIADATHVLRLCHSIGQNKRHYTARCIVLGYTKQNKARVLKFGWMGYVGHNDEARISYVDRWKLSEITLAK